MVLADFSEANLSYADLRGANLSNANMSHSMMIACKTYRDMTCSNTDFSDAIMDEEQLVTYLNVKGR